MTSKFKVNPFLLILLIASSVVSLAMMLSGLYFQNSLAGFGFVLLLNSAVGAVGILNPPTVFQVSAEKNTHHFKAA